MPENSSRASDRDEARKNQEYKKDRYMGDGGADARASDRDKARKYKKKKKKYKSIKQLRDSIKNSARAEDRDYQRATEREELENLREDPSARAGRRDELRESAKKSKIIKESREKARKEGYPEKLKKYRKKKKKVKTIQDLRDIRMKMEGTDK